ncbi:hypothetical protein [Amycolatopsis anabasis]|uniref:hypothetical protein n=1 Tax=Amycolatopsis anabasis TaxID=1840409 RepID=UPI00131D8D8D|nr:hypothetical protein [Amycolatopsis anabasis]
MRIRRIAGIAGAGVLVAGIAAWWVTAGEDAFFTPHEDADLENSALPVIDEYLHASPFGPGTAGSGTLSRSFPQLGPRWFCTERIVESRLDGDELRVGLDTACEEFARRGDALVQGTGTRARW